MKKTLSIVSLALVAVLMMGILAACGGNKLSDGTYKLVEMIQDGEDLSDQLSTMEEAGISMDLVVNGDKATLMDTELTIKDGKISDGNEEIPYTVSGNKITLEQDGTKMVFEKK